MRALRGSAINIGKRCRSTGPRRGQRPAIPEEGQNILEVQKTERMILLVQDKYQKSHTFHGREELHLDRHFTRQQN